jgi:hypothetical protein
MKQNEVVLGNRYRDTVSGWEGVATGRFEYMNGCFRICLGGTDKDGQPEDFVFDVEQIVPVDAPAVERSAPSPTGGPRDNRAPSR